VLGKTALTDRSLQLSHDKAVDRLGFYLSVEEDTKEFHIHELFKHINAVVSSTQVPDVDAEDEAEDPASIPIYWVAKWVDYSDKYGLGYQLCDNSIGVLFNDSTRLILAQNGE